VHTLGTPYSYVKQLGLARTVYIRRICRVGQDHIYTVYIRYFWQGNHQIYGHARCIPVYGSGQPYVYDRISDKTPAQNTVYTL